MNSVKYGPPGEKPKDDTEKEIESPPIRPNKHQKKTNTICIIHKSF